MLEASIRLVSYQTCRVKCFLLTHTCFFVCTHENLSYLSDPSLIFSIRRSEFTAIAQVAGCAGTAHDQSSNSEMAQFLKKALRIEGPQLSQKTVTIRKNARESLGMRIGGGIGSNEGDTPIYIANIHPHGCIGKSKQMKVGAKSVFN